MAHPAKVFWRVQIRDVGAFDSSGFQVGEEQEEGEFDGGDGDVDFRVTASREDREFDGSGFQVSAADQERGEFDDIKSFINCRKLEEVASKSYAVSLDSSLSEDSSLSDKDSELPHMSRMKPLPVKPVPVKPLPTPP